MIPSVTIRRWAERPEDEIVPVEGGMDGVQSGGRKSFAFLEGLRQENVGELE
jgi:hypothetical protein